MKNSFLKKAIPHVIALVSFMALAMIYFYPQIQGKQNQMSDITQYKAMANEATTYQKETGETVLWTGTSFAGMPTFQLTAPMKNNLLLKVRNKTMLGIPRPIGWYFLGMACFYLLLISLGANYWLSAIGAMIFAFATGTMVLFDTGHTSKVMNFFTSPPMIAGLILIFRKKYLTGFILFSVFLALNIGSNHLQMTYYLGLCLGFVVLFHMVECVKNREFAVLGKQLGLLVIGTVLAVSTSASKLYTTIEFSKSTMRGEPILQANNSSSVSSSTTEGLAWVYATEWSNGPLDLFASFIPNVAGGSIYEILPNDSKIIKQLPNYRNQPLPTYWGKLGSTSGPYYFGALVFLLFIFGAFAVRKPVKWWVVSAVVLIALLSLGKNFEFFNKFLFDHLPLFNKFRAPSSVMGIAVLFVPLLSILGLKELGDSKDKEKFLKPLYYSAGSLAAICLFFALLGPSFFDFSSSIDANLGQYADAMRETRKNMMASSAFKSLLFIAIGAIGVYFYIKGKIKYIYLIIGIGVFSILDLFSVNKRYLNESDFFTPRQTQQNFTPRPVDQQILADPDIHYRVLDIPNFQSAIPSYHHKTIGGYNPAKLQRYQDLIDYHISKNNQQVLDMLNTKYIIFNQADGKLGVQRNSNADGNAWFVKSIRMVETANAEIEALNTVDPSNTAVVHTEFSDYLGANNTYTGQGSINLTTYSPNKLTYKVNSTGENMAVFSEIWYQPGWQAYLDGKPVEHIRVDYILRAMLIPNGQHEVVFEFKPRSYFIGETISLISSLLLILISIGGVYWKFFKKQ